MQIGEASFAGRYMGVFDWLFELSDALEFGILPRYLVSLSKLGSDSRNHGDRPLFCYWDFTPYN